MNKKMVIVILSVLLTLMLGVNSCITITSTPTARPSPSKYHTLLFTLEEKGDYSFPVYLRNNETLHLIMRAENLKSNIEYKSVYLHILTPSGKTLGSYGRQLNNPGEYANGTLSDFACQGFEIFKTQFSPSDYDWGEGYYTMIAENEFRDPVAVIVEYWIER